MIDFTSWKPKPSQELESLLLSQPLLQDDHDALIEALGSWAQAELPSPDFNGMKPIADPVLDINDLERSEVEEALAEWTPERHRDAHLYDIGNGIRIGATWDPNHPTPIPFWHGLFTSHDQFHQHIAARGFISSMDQFQHGQ